MKYVCFLVVANKQPIALVRCWNSSQKLIYGRDVALSYFESGQPMTDLELVEIRWIANDPSHPLIGLWIDKLKRRQERKPTVNLDEDTKAAVRELRDKGWTIKQLVERFKVSEATIKRICRNKANETADCSDADPHTLGVTID